MNDKKGKTWGDEHPKNKKFTIRLTEYEHMVFKEMSDILEKPMSDLVRIGMGIIRCEGMTEEQKKIFVNRTTKKAKAIHSQKRQRS